MADANVIAAAATQASGTNWGLVAAFLIFIGIIGVLVFIALRRRMSSFPITVRDLRNPRNQDEHYYAQFDKRNNQIKLWKTLLHPWTAGLVPPIDMRAFKMSGGQVYGYRGVSGKDGDDNIVLLSWPLVGQVGAAQQSQKLSDAVQNTLKFFETCSKYFINDEVTFNFNAVPLDGIITNIDYKGIEISVLEKEMVEVEVSGADGKKKKEKQEKEVINKYILPTVSEIVLASIKVKKHPEGEKALKPAIDSFFTAEWVLANFGIVPVNDVNVIMRNQKDAIAEFNSKVNDREKSRLSWLERNPLLVTIAIIFLCTAVMFAIMGYATQQYVTATVGQGITTLNNGVLQILNHTATSLGHPGA